MNTKVECPLPELADALQPYILPRDDAARIRRVADLVLHEHHEGSEQTITRFTTLPSADVARSIKTRSPSGIRSAYANAIVARQKALDRLSRLRAELAAFQEDTKNHELNHPEANLDETLSVISSIRWEQRRRKLRIVERGINEIETQRHKSQHADVTNVLNNDKHTLAPPPSDVGAHETRLRQNVTSKITQLKKAVLQSQSLVNTKCTTYTDEACSVFPDETAENPHLTALTRTRDHIISWLENELSRIPEDDDLARDASTPSTSAGAGQQIMEEHVHATYKHYLDQRKALVDVVAAMEGPKVEMLETDHGHGDVAALKSSRLQQKTACLAADVLPYAEELSSIVEGEAALMQDSTFVRQQLAWSLERTRQLLHRLADESHLVAPGVTDTRAWARASKEARADDTEMIHSRLIVGENSLRGAHEAA
ncbi:hypothetical protein BDV97DRAFT_396427 [Delphinella strobiligena]|nr:hypothetical protein BDV97DRAFT_396427 [Delphinella strobiligena]